VKAHFERFASYNRWANARLYEAALALSDSDYRRDVGVFFGSMHGTLNHLLVTDRMWLKRLTGEGEHPDRLDAIMHEDRFRLALARAEEDDRIAKFIASLDEAAIAGMLKYTNSTGRQFEQPCAEILAHWFNHQTHHRGHAHAILSIVTGREPPSLDMVGLQRGLPAPDLHALVKR
jgi:uncharacterized damage-inducible protein DinB